ncbi:probable glutathione S-transferase GSTF1 [Miscanthus floridulus]|uniref:probable glutathione S-transferase GSTF1 n=1 Tax=Miscanthus floridulus TaxID=154761 RepID=UPI0034576338
MTCAEQAKMAPVKVFRTADFVNAARVMACLEEVGMEYEVVEVDYSVIEHKGPQHLARNVPSESGAIAKYVLRKYSKSAQVDLLREGNPEEAAMVDVWTEVEAHTYLPAIAPIFYECVVYAAEHGTSPNQKAVEESLEKLKKMLDVYEAHLSKSKHLYLAGDFFSLADLNHVPYTFHIMSTPHASLFDSYPHVKAWWERVMARPSLKKLSPDMEINA